MQDVKAFILDNASEMSHQKILERTPAEWAAEAVRRAGIDDIIFGMETDGDGAYKKALFISALAPLVTPEAIRALAAQSCAALVSDGRAAALVCCGAAVSSAPDMDGALAALEGQSHSVERIECDDQMIFLDGYAQKIEISNILRSRIMAAYMANGVDIRDPYNTTISPDAEIGRGTVILPGCLISGDTKIGRDCLIGPMSVICGSVIGDRTTVNASQIYDSRIGDDCTVGPFAHIRGHARLGNHLRVGNFVEIKKSDIGDGTKMAHLAYCGDAKVGERVNLGCGTIVVNYDGKNKSLTEIGDGAFIGSNSNLVAPVKIGADVFIAAGSTIAGDLPDGAFAIARSKPYVKEGGAYKYLKKDGKTGKET